MYVHLLESGCGEPRDGLGDNGFIHLINSGSATLETTGRQERDGQSVMKPFWEINEADVQACLDATTWYPANNGYFREGGYSSNFLTWGGMPVTRCRVNLFRGLGPVLQIAEGHTVALPEAVHNMLDNRTDNTWPTTWFVSVLTDSSAFRFVYSVMANWVANFHRSGGP